eukprot:scaffold4328_cov135-Isochrysis_galbana.AAC.7
MRSSAAEREEGAAGSEGGAEGRMSLHPDRQLDGPTEAVRAFRALAERGFRRRRRLRRLAPAMQHRDERGHARLGVVLQGVPADGARVVLADPVKEAGLVEVVAARHARQRGHRAIALGRRLIQAAQADGAPRARLGCNATLELGDGRLRRGRRAGLAHADGARDEVAEDAACNSAG